MKTRLFAGFIVTLSLLMGNNARSQMLSIDSLPVRGLCIAAPDPENLDAFVKFIREELPPRKVNMLILRIDYNYQFKSHPELRDAGALSATNVKKIVSAYQQSGIQLIPEIDLLGHQSWAGHLRKLLQVYPQFDETPRVKMPADYKWPNADNLYCKSYCPLAPGLHQVIFDLIDELCDVFESKAFHAGMDEVFYIGESQCPRCGGKDPAALFAGEVTAIRNHLAEKGRTLWIWGDRLIDGKTTGMGMWEASMNNTYRAIDMIPKDVVICDWHYERADQTAVYFATKGFNVVSCPFRQPETALQQVEDMIRFRGRSTSDMNDRYRGIVETSWSDAGSFLKDYYNQHPKKNTAARVFKTIFPK